MASRGRRAFSVGLATLALACSTRADPTWMQAELDRAHARDREARAAHVDDDERAHWALELVGPTGTSESIPFRALAALPRTEIDTVEPDEAAHDDVVHFSGVRVLDLVRRAAGGESAPEVTIVASDGFRATVSMDDVRLFPILLAMDANGAPLGRDHGGPLYSVFPFSGSPELAQRYTSSSWVFYVTHLLVGTAPPALRVGTRELGAAALAALPTTSISAVVGYRTGWPSEPVALQGVRVRDVLASAGVALGDGDHVRVLSRALITRGEERPTRISARDVLDEDVILALRYGPGADPIPSRLGGPTALAFPSEVGAHLTDHDWLTFVDGLVVEPAGAGEESAP